MSVFLCAETGSTHQGNLALAQECVLAAKEAGADAVKFIASNPDELIADRSIKFVDQLLYDVVDSYRFKSDDLWRLLADFCREIGIDFFVTLGTPDYLPLMLEIGVSKLKIGSWDSRNFPLIDACLDTGLPLWFDFGAVIEPEVDGLYHYCSDRAVVEDLTFLHETHSPNPAEWNLNTIPFMKDRWPSVTVGFSSGGIEDSCDLLALGLGAQVIEKRLKPRGHMGHHSHQALEPEDFAIWVQMMRTAESMMGKEGLYPSMADVAAKQHYFTSLVFDQDVKKGKVVTEDMLASRRPGRGLSPYYSYLWMGKRLARDVERNEILTYDTCEGTVE